MKSILYILFCSYIFSYLNWQTVHQTRWVHPENDNWMHAHELSYVSIMEPLEIIVCTPCMALEPIFFYADMQVNASMEERKLITHAPDPTIYGFYRLIERGYSWSFISWSSWFLYWLVPSILWGLSINKLAWLYRKRKML